MPIPPDFSFFPVNIPVKTPAKIDAITAIIPAVIRKSTSTPAFSVYSFFIYIIFQFSVIKKPASVLFI